MIHESYLNKPKIIIHITKIKRYKTCINVLITYSRAEPSILFCSVPEVTLGLSPL